MRPDRAVVKKAIVDAENNLRKASALLGCSRQTLYTWIYQLGLERFAGVCMDTRAELDTRERVDGSIRKQTKSGVYSGGSSNAKIRLVQDAATADLPIQATCKVRESLWRRVKIAAIQRKTTLSDVVETALEAELSRAAKDGGEKLTRKDGANGGKKA